MEDALPGDAGAPGDAMGEGTPSQPAALCQPAPAWLTEGETLELDIVCAGRGRAEGGAAVVIEPLPAGAVYDPAAGRLTWTPALDQAAVYHLTASIPERKESIVLTIGVADRWDHPDNVPIVDREAYTMEYGLPVFFLSPPPQDNDHYEPTTIVHGGRTYEAKGKIRGSASLRYPKNSYTLKFPKDDLFSDPERAGGFSGKRKVVLTTTFDDNSYVRQRLAFELWNSLDPAHIQVQSYMGVVYLEDEFWGLYAVTDHIDGDLMEHNGLWRDGNLYKGKSSNANFRLVDKYGQPKKDIIYGFDKKEGIPEHGTGAHADLEALIRFVATADEATIERELGMHIDLRDYMDWMIMVSFMVGRDSGANNAYHYQQDPGSPWRVVMWDFNATFGQDYITKRVSSDKTDFYEDDNQIFEHFVAIPAFADQVAARFRMALDGALAVPRLHALIDEVLVDIRGVVPRDQARWREAYESFELWDDRDDFTTHEEEIEYLRTWLADRWAFLNERY